jgi:MOSC domain-containing protein YiiM
MPAMIDVDDRAYTHDDVLGTLRALGPWWRQLAEGRPLAPIAAAAAEQVGALQFVLGETAEASDDVLADIDRLGTTAAVAFDRLRWNHGHEETAARLLGASLTALHSATDALRVSASLPPRAEGTVAGLFVSGGGVPKHAIASVVIDRNGVLGDRQRTRRHHGRPWQALCLWSSEVVELLRAEGHPIHLGAAGENVSITGIDWSTVRSGVRLRIGTAVAEVSVFALPCKQNAQWFVGGRFDRMHHDRGPVSRAYATVLEPGEAAVGDEVVLEPTPTLDP